MGGCVSSVYLNLSEGQSFYLGRSSSFPDVEENISAVQIPDRFQGQRELFPHWNILALFRAACRRALVQLTCSISVCSLKTQ